MRQSRLPDSIHLEARRGGTEPCPARLIESSPYAGEGSQRTRLGSGCQEPCIACAQRSASQLANTMEWGAQARGGEGCHGPLRVVLDHFVSAWPEGGNLLDSVLCGMQIRRCLKPNRGVFLSSQDNELRGFHGAPFRDVDRCLGPLGVAESGRTSRGRTSPRKLSLLCRD